MKAGKIIGSIAAVTLGVVAGLGTAAAVGAYIGFKKWAKDEDSDCIRIVIGQTKGIRISKTEEKDKYEVEFNYDWQADPDFFDCENCSKCDDCDDCCSDSEECCCTDSAEEGCSCCTESNESGADEAREEAQADVRVDAADVE